MSTKDNPENENENVKPKEADGLNTRPLPIIITLTAAGLSCVLSIIQGRDFSIFFLRLLVSVLVFSFLGSLIKILLDFIFNKKPKEEEVVDENEEIVIEDGDRVENIDTEDDDELSLQDEEDIEPMEGDES